MFHVLPEHPVPFRVMPFSSAAMMSILSLSTRRYLRGLICQAWLIHAVECVRSCCKSLKSKIYARSTLTNSPREVEHVRTAAFLPRARHGRRAGHRPRDRGHACAGGSDGYGARPPSRNAG